MGPLFPGDSDTDQLYHITKCLGNLTPRHQELFYKNPLFAGMRFPEVKEAKSLDKRYPKLPAAVLDLAKKCLQIDPHQRPSCAEFLECDFFNKDAFAERFAQDIQEDARDHQLNKKKSKISKRDKDQKERDQQVEGGSFGWLSFGCLSGPVDWLLLVVKEEYQCELAHQQAVYKLGC
ncbi:LOW QUALITY PROTEIN: cyclin-dependent kinase-like 2 [Amazona ochrocephala]